MFGLALIYGFLAAAAALLVQVFASFFMDIPSFNVSPSVFVLLGAATLEEGARLVFLLQLAKHHPKATSFLHAFLFGIGFVVAELSLLALSPTSLPDPLLIAQTALVHLGGTFLIYSGLCYQRTFPLAPFVALLGAILLHTLYNTSL